MRIAVLGAGRQGLACAIDLLREKDVEEVLLLDSDGELLDRARGEIHDPRLRVVTADASDEAAIAEHLRGCAAAVSAVPYFLNLGLTRAAIRAQCCFTDMGGNTDVVLQQRALDPEARKAGITIIPDLGLAPGLGNILAAHAIEGIDSVDRVKIRCGGLPLEPEPPLGYALFFSIHGLLNEYSGDSICIRDGKITKIPTLTEPEWILFPEPVGLCRAVHTSGGSSTLPYSLEGKVKMLDYKTVRYPGHWPRIRLLKDLGFLETTPVGAAGGAMAPRDMLAAMLHPVLDRRETRDVVVLRVEARGRTGDVRRTRRFDLLELGDSRPGLTAMMKLTAYPTAAVALELARGAIAARGVLEAERSVSAPAMIRHLESRGIGVRRSETDRHGRLGGAEDH